MTKELTYRQEILVNDLYRDVERKDGYVSRFHIHKRNFGDNYSEASGYIRDRYWGLSCAISIPRCSDETFDAVVAHVISQTDNLHASNTKGKPRWYDVFKWNPETRKYSALPSNMGSNLIDKFVHDDIGFFVRKSYWRFGNYRGRFNMNSIRIHSFYVNKENDVSFKDLCEYIQEGPVKELLNVITQKEFRLEKEFLDLVNEFNRVTIGTLVDAYNKYTDNKIGTFEHVHTQKYDKYIYYVPSAEDDYDGYCKAKDGLRKNIECHRRNGEHYALVQLKKLDPANYQEAVDSVSTQKRVEAFTKAFMA